MFARRDREFAIGMVAGALCSLVGMIGFSTNDMLQLRATSAAAAAGPIIEEEVLPYTYPQQNGLRLCDVYANQWVPIAVADTPMGPVVKDLPIGVLRGILDPDGMVKNGRCGQHAPPHK